MKKTNFYVLESASWSLKSLITGAFMLVLLGIANHGSAQSAPRSPEDVLPPLKSKTECIEIAKGNSEALLEQMKQINDPNNPLMASLRAKYNGYQFVINLSTEPAFEMPIILAQLYPSMHPNSNDGTATGAYGFFTKSWNREYSEIVNNFKK